jgi:hypothetical protein
MNTIEVTKTLMPTEPDAVQMLVGFEYAGENYEIVLFDFGDQVVGGAIGVWKIGDNFVARLGLDALVRFNKEAKSQHIEGTA